MAQNQGTSLSVTNGDAELAAIAATKNDLTQMSEGQRAQLYGAVCRSVGLNPLTSPFEYIKLNGKLTLYAKKGATDQIRETRGISIVNIEQDTIAGVLMVTATATDKNGRTDSDVGAVVVEGLKGEALANAYMKAITKAKRRVTLSIAGLGFLDETEVESVPSAVSVSVDHQTGEIVSVEYTAPASPVAPSEDAKERAMKRLHAVAAKHGFTHDDLHFYALAKNVDSLTAFNAETLNGIADGFEQRTDAAVSHFNALREKYAPPAISPEVDPATGEIVPPSESIQSELIELPDTAHVGHGDA